MKRITFWFMSTLSALVMLFSYHTSTEAVAAKAPTSVATAQTASSASTDSGTSQTTTSGSGAAGSSGGSGGSSTSSSSSASATDTSAAKTYTGDAISTRYGNVQVEITVKNGAVTSVKAVDYPMENGRDQEINSVAIPTLNEEATSAKSASIDMVSGATYTSNGYIQSLQSALDQANL